MDEIEIKFPDGATVTKEISALDLDGVAERLCGPCGGAPSSGKFGAGEYTVVQCPKCQMLYPGDPVQ